MPWTPLHDAVGASNDSLSFSLVEQACADGVEEQGNLDWKQTLPLQRGSTLAQKEAQHQELAKDIAAMANSGGGMIVYGVAEKGGTSAADLIVPVGPVDEPITRQIRQVAGNLIYPPVAGLELIRITPPGDEQGGVLAMVIPDSPDAPHLVHKKGDRSWFGAPCVTARRPHG